MFCVCVCFMFLYLFIHKTSQGRIHCFHAFSLSLYLQRDNRCSFKYWFANKHILSSETKAQIYRTHRVSLHPSSSQCIQFVTCIICALTHAHTLYIHNVYAKHTLRNIICMYVSLHSGREIALRDIDCIQSYRKGIFFLSTSTVRSPFSSPSLSPSLLLRVTPFFHAPSNFVNDHDVN